MLGRIKVYIAAGVAAMIGALGVLAYILGGANEESKNDKRRIEAIKRAKEVSNEVQGMDDQRLIDVLRDGVQHDR